MKWYKIISDAYVVPLPNLIRYPNNLLERLWLNKNDKDHICHQEWYFNEKQIIDKLIIKLHFNTATGEISVWIVISVESVFMVGDSQCIEVDPLTMEEI